MNQMIDPKPRRVITNPRDRVNPTETTGPQFPENLPPPLVANPIVAPQVLAAGAHQALVQSNRRLAANRPAVGQIVAHATL